MNNIDKIKLLVKEIQNLFFQKKYDLIIKETQKAINIYPKLSIFYNMMGLALTQTGKLQDAKYILEKGYKINSNDIAIINNLANVYKNIHNYIEAEKLYNLSILKEKNYFNAYINYGNLKRDLNKFDDAIKLYKKALEYNKNVPEIYYSLAMAYQALGAFEKSEYYAHKTIEINKKITKADLLISRSKKYHTLDPHFKSMVEKTKQKDLNTIQKIDLYFALAKAYEDLNDIENSFKYIEQGNKLKRSVVYYNFNEEKNKFESIKKIFQNLNIPNLKNKDPDSKNIIFIVGMPRSGTTLVEQIISSHSQVCGNGELPYLSKIINDNFTDNKILSSKKINDTLNDNDLFSQISKKYYSHINNYEISSKFITDKAPLNFIWIGFIKIFFSNAKIVHCKRNEKDNCVSLYKNVFDGSLNFCYNQEELGNYYNLYSKLISFWKSNLPNAFLDIEYESLVKNTEKETRKILDYCGLDWENNCLDFSKNKTPIKTASVGQARNKIYSTSVKSSSKYELYLDKLFRLVEKKSPS